MPAQWPNNCDKYAEAALVDAERQLSLAKKGDRNNKLNNIVFSLGQLVGAGILSGELVESRMLSISMSIGLPEKESKYHIHKSLRSGMEHPREIKNETSCNRSNNRPPKNEVESLWNASRRLDASTNEKTVLSKCKQYCIDRGWNPKDIAALGIARSMPDPNVHKYPTWWPADKASNWNLIIIAYEYNGAVASIHARSINNKIKPKTLWPSGYSARELLFASPCGLALLRNEKIATLDYTVIVEGITDYIAASIWACKQQCTKNETVAILGITSGSINALSKINWPDGKKVIIATDNDDAGNLYAKKIRKAIPENIELMRNNCKSDNDIADILKSNGNPFEEIIPLEPEEPEKQYDLITLADMKPTKTKWMIDGMIPDESCVIVGAEEKSGKTWLMFYMALCVISGRKMFDRFQVGKNGKVIIYSPESGWNAKSQRMWGLCWGMGLDPQKTLTSAIFIKGKLDLSESECIESLKKDVARIKPAIIMLDPLICLHNGIDENASGEIQKLLNSIREISQCQPGMSVLVAHHLNKGHQGKSNFHGLRGSSAIGAWADGRISITRQPGGTNPIRRIDIEHRDAPSPLPIGFRIEERQCQISHDGLPAFHLEPYEVDIEKNTRLSKIVLEQVLHVVVSYRGITRYEGAAKVGISRSKFNRYFDYLANQGKVRLDELDRMYPI